MSASTQRYALKRMKEKMSETKHYKIGDENNGE